MALLGNDVVSVTWIRSSLPIIDFSHGSPAFFLVPVLADRPSQDPDVLVTVNPGGATPEPIDDRGTLKGLPAASTLTALVSPTGVT
jgi:hypothetical protein